MDELSGLTLRQNEGGPTTKDKNFPPKIILDPLQTNIEGDSNSGCLTFKPLMWKTQKCGLGVMEQPHYLEMKCH